MVSDSVEEATPIDEPAPSFVDGLWLHLHAAVSPLAEKRLAMFVRQRGVSKWIIATDFCIRERSRPNDSFAFVIFPAGQRLAETQKMLAKLPARDLKDTKKIPASLQRALRKGRIFTFCFAADRFRRLFPSPEVARRSIDETISMMGKWENAAACEDIIAKIRAMRAEASKANLNTRLLEDIVVTTAISYAPLQA
jgi:hypothetical protein